MSRVQYRKPVKAHQVDAVTHTLRTYYKTRSAEVMSRTGVNPETRNIMKVTYDDAEAMVKAFDDWMGNGAQNRKEYIETELNKYDEIA